MVSEIILLPSSSKEVSSLEERLNVLYSENKLLEEPDDDDDFYSEEVDDSEREEIDFDIDHLDATLGGEVKVESEFGKGTEVVIRIPTKK